MMSDKRSPRQKFVEDGTFYGCFLEGFTHYRRVKDRAHSEMRYFLRLKRTYTISWRCLQPSSGVLGMDITRPKLYIPRWFPLWVHAAQLKYRKATHDRWKRKQVK